MTAHEPVTIGERYRKATTRSEASAIGEKRYFTGKPCPKGHVAERLTSNATCIECMLAKKREWHDKNKEALSEKKRDARRVCGDQIRERQRASYLKNKEAANSRTAQYYADNKERILDQQKQWRLRNPGVVAENVSAWASRNIEKVREIKRAYAKRNRDAKRISVQNRRAKKRENGGTLSKGLAKRLHLLQRGKCPCCGEPLGDDYHLDHIVPIHLGGPNVDSNIQLLRSVCNLRKRALDPIQYMQKKGFLL